LRKATLYIKNTMEIKLKELLSSIDSRFSGPASCRLNDMITGRLDFDDEEVEKYLIRLKNFRDIHGSNNKNERKDAATYLKLFTQYIDESNKKRE